MHTGNSLLSNVAGIVSGLHDLDFIDATIFFTCDSVIDVNLLSLGTSSLIVGKVPWNLARILSISFSKKSANLFAKSSSKWAGVSGLTLFVPIIEMTSLYSFLVLPIASVTSLLKI